MITQCPFQTHIGRPIHLLGDRLVDREISRVRVQIENSAIGTTGSDLAVFPPSGI